MNELDEPRAPGPSRPTHPPEGGGPRQKAGRPTTGRRKKLANGLVALSTAAVMAIYGVGYAHTASAVDLTGGEPTAVISSLLVTSTPTMAPATATTVPAIATATATSARRAASNPQATSATTATATPNASPTATPGAASTATELRDGTYNGTGTSRHGSIGVSVVVQGGKIVSAEITNCGTRYPCSKIATLPGQVIANQGTDVDFVSGSTDSSQAYVAAVKAALAKAV